MSRVLNGRTVSPANERLVMAAAQKLNYTPNRIARTLRRQLEVVALMIPDIENPSSPLRPRRGRHRPGGRYSVVLCNTDGDAAKEEYSTSPCPRTWPGSASAAGNSAAAPPRPGRAVDAVDRPIEGADVDSVVIDNVGAGRLATRALWDAGFRDIACVTGPAEIVTAVDRGRGWEQFSWSSPPLSHPSRARRLPGGGGRARMTELLERQNPPDAVVAGNNLVGVGALQVLNERGLTSRSSASR